MTAQTDYDLQGIVGIRLLDATRGDIAAVTRQVGPIHATLARDPDITIRFVDRMPLTSSIRLLGLDDAGFTDDAFFVLRSKHKARAKVNIPFQHIGRRCEIVCERGLPAVPLLIPIVNFTMLAKGVLPLHASAFTYNGIGALATGWAKGGKTETLLAFVSRGAQYVGDEWVYLSADGQTMYGIPEPIRLWHWHLREVPQYWAHVKLVDRLRLKGLTALVEAMDRVASSEAGRRLRLLRGTRRITYVMRQQLYVQLPPKATFGRTDAGPLEAAFGKLFFVASHDDPAITVAPADPADIARRMVFSLQYERLDLWDYYLKFRFAFPDLQNDLIENAEELQGGLLRRALAGKEAYTVWHPYPVSIAALFEAISPYV